MSLIYLECIMVSSPFTDRSKISKSTHEYFDIELVDSSISSPWCNICDRPLEYCRCENK